MSASPPPLCTTPPENRLGSQTSAVSQTACWGSLGIGNGRYQQGRKFGAGPLEKIALFEYEHAFSVQGEKSS